jgi:signal transduction histidine kinase
MSSFVLVPLFAAFVNLGLALFVFTRDTRLRINQVFMVWGASLAVWNAGAFMMFTVSGHDQALLWARILHFGVIFIPVSILHLTALLSRRRIGLSLTLAYGFTGAMAAMNCTSLFIRDVRYVGYAWFAVAGPGLWIFSASFSLMTFPALYMLWLARRDAPPAEAKKFTTLLLANAMLMVLGSHDLMPVLGYDEYPILHFKVYPWGQFGACIYGVLVAFSVLHDQLLDVRISLGRQAATVLRLAFLVATAYLLLTLASVLIQGSFSEKSFIITLVVVAVSAGIAGIAFPRLVGGNSDSLERRILGDRFEYQEQMREFSRSLRTFTDIEKIVNETLTHLAAVMRLESASIVVLDAKTHEVRYGASHPHNLTSSIAGLTADSPVFEYFRSTKTKLIDLRNSSDSAWTGNLKREARQSLSALKPEYVYVLTTDGVPAGIVIFGRKVREVPYTQIDVEVCSELVEQLSFAVERIRLSEAGALNERLDTMSVMSRGLAHDLNNLITPISIFLQVTAKNYADGPEADIHRVARRNIDTIKSYVREAIFFSESHGTNLTQIDPRALLTGVSELCQQRAERKMCAIDCDCTEDNWFNGDRILLQRMLSNLVNNAIDASPANASVTLRAFWLEGTRSRPARMRFQVIDQGTGIAQEDLERVWEPYWTTKTEGDVNRGFGLGLTVVQKIVLLHKGSVIIQSKVGSGTTVQADIPCNLGQEDAA